MTTPFPVGIRTKDRIIWHDSQIESAPNPGVRLKKAQPVGRQDEPRVKFVTLYGGLDSLGLPHPLYKAASSEFVTQQRSAITWLEAPGLNAIDLRSNAAQEAARDSSQASVVAGEFGPSRDLLALILASQSDGDARDLSPGSLNQALCTEVGRRIIEVFADTGYRWKARRKKSGSIARFESGELLNWCEADLAAMLMRDLNVSLLAANKVLQKIFLETRSFLEQSSISGDWGSLENDGQHLMLRPAS